MYYKKYSDKMHLSLVPQQLSCSWLPEAAEDSESIFTVCCIGKAGCIVKDACQPDHFSLLTSGRRCRMLKPWLPDLKLNDRFLLNAMWLLNQSPLPQHLPRGVVLLFNSTLFSYSIIYSYIFGLHYTCTILLFISNIYCCITTYMYSLV